MKKIILFITVLFSSLLSQAQVCSDVVYPTEGKYVIFDCCIEEVYDGNKVRFTKNDTTLIIEAISIIKEGLTLNLKPLESYVLYKGFNHSYYTEKYEQARIKQRVGLLVGVAGFIELITGILLMGDTDVPIPQVLFLTGIATISTGVPLAISGLVEEKKNREAMEKTKNNARLSLGLTNHGVGLVLNF